MVYPLLNASPSIAFDCKHFVGGAGVDGWEDWLTARAMAGLNWHAVVCDHRCATFRSLVVTTAAVVMVPLL